MMRQRLRMIAIVCLTLGLVACSWRAEEVVIPPSNKVSADVDSRDNALINLSLSPVTTKSSDLSGIQLQQLRNDYVELVPLVEELSDKTTTELSWRGLLNQEIRNRLADIEMLIAEEAQADGKPLSQGDNYYQVAIQSYRQLLAESEQSATPLEPIAKENLLYQLARAYSLQGQDAQSLVYGNQLLKAFPFSDFANELHFRQGEYFYNQNDYVAAVKAYRKVVDGVFDPYAVDGQRRIDVDDPFYAMSAYMLGWSYFKREQYSRSIDAFALMLEVSLSPNEYTQTHTPLESLELSQRKLVEDSLDMMALMFAAEGGAIAINGYYATEDNKPYIWLVYNALAQQFLDDSRYRDSADTFVAFANRFPRHPQAIAFFVKHIDVYILGDFPTEVLPAKQRFVESYGLYGANWQGFNSTQTMQAFPYLEEYLKQLAQFEHALAQQADDVLNQLPSDSNNSELIHQRRKTQSTKDMAYSLAQRWYREYIATFSPSEDAANMQFYLAESLFEVKDFSAAITEYESFAFNYSEHPSAANAAYAALLSHAQIDASAAQIGSLTPLQISQIEFLSNFETDRRAVDIGILLIQDLFDKQFYFDAITWSQWLLDRSLSADNMQIAQLVLAQSQFELRDYQGSQAVFHQLLGNIDKQNILYPVLIEKLAATYYQQAQQALEKVPNASGIGATISTAEARALRSGVERLMQVIIHTPSSEIAVNARYDAATYLMKLSDWQAAIELMVDFEQRYPANELTASIPEKLILAYEKDQQWLAAAQRLELIWQANKDNESGREALYLAAEYSERGGDRDIALIRYRDYAHSYFEPVALANEARFKLSEYYLQRKEPQKRRFWLRKLVDVYQQGPAGLDVRGRYLAAFAATVFADDDYREYSQIKLTLPLNKSIQLKRQAMQQVLDANQMIIDIKIAEFSTKAGYRLGQAYIELAQALYQSERPTELDALALEQYDILLEEQAFPFEEQAIEIHTTNIQRSWQGRYDHWVAQSFASLASLLPAKFDKPESFSGVNYADF